MKNPIYLYSIDILYLLFIVKYNLYHQNVKYNKLL